MNSIRNDFPILTTTVNQKPLVYFDNAASTQKPIAVIDSIDEYYKKINSNIHRGAHYLANLATEKYENVRTQVAAYIGAKAEEIIFTSGTTQSINLLMNSWGRKFLTNEDEIVLTEMEHHANLVPWLALQSEIGFKIQYLPMKSNCELDLSQIDQIITAKTKLVSIAYISNAIGTIHPITEIIAASKKIGALVHLDCAQAVQHLPINVRTLNVDFLSFSSHKMYGPMGIGVFWGKSTFLNEMNPYLYGGEMIKEVHLDHFTVNELPYKFEAGTPNVADVIGLGAAINYIQSIGLEEINQLESGLQKYMMSELKKIDRVVIFTPENNSTAVVSFNIDNAHPFDVGQLLDAKGIAIRTGHHCCQPLMRKLGIEGTCRASLAFYNTKEEVDSFISALKSIVKLV
jgi:cysteine desulfurase / selenocysteine lyase